MPTGVYLRSLICNKGHDISVVGRNKWGRCNQCYKEDFPGIKIKRFCLRGHDTSICGRNKISRQCNDCRRENLKTPQRKKLSRERMRRVRRKGWAFIREMKTNKPCMDCGNIFPPECMDFDHREGEIKLFGLSSQAWRTTVALQKEIEKCDLICSNCHRIRTFKREQQKFIKRMD